jgi:hypothetical protein
MAVAFVQESTGSSGAASTTLACALGAAPTVGNLLVFCMAGDKNTGDLTLAGFTRLYSILSSSTSLYMWWKVSDGSETTINPSWGTSSTAGNTAWYAEYQDAAVNGSMWRVSAQASTITTEATVNSAATGSSISVPVAGMGIACNAMDSSASWVSGTTWSDSYVEKYSATGLGGRGAIFISTKSVSAGSSTTATFSYTGTADQNTVALAVFSKVLSINNTPATTIIDDFNRSDGGLGSAWTGVVESGHGTPVILSNRIVGTTAGVHNSAYYDLFTYLDSESRITWPAAATSLGTIKCYTRISNPGASVNAYYVYFHGDNNLTYIHRLYGGSDSGALQTFSVDPQIGWKLCNITRNTGTDIVVEAWYNSGSSWVMAGAYTDAGAVSIYPNLANPGYFGFSFFVSSANSATYSLDDAGGGFIRLESSTSRVTIR